MMRDTLYAWRDGILVAKFSYASKTDITYSYATTKFGVMSLSLPFNGKSTPKAPYRWLLGLLPTNESTLVRLSNQYGISRDDPFHLLQVMGHDAVGAYTFSERGVPSSNEKLKLVTAGEIVSAIESIKGFNGVPEIVRSTHVSIGGYQDKFVLSNYRNNWYLPTRYLPSTHIFKPCDPDVLNGDYLESGLLNLANGIRLLAAESDVFLKSLVVKRFDRQETKQGISRRLHQEDLLQAMGVDKSKKYSIDALTILKFLRSSCGDRVAYEFLAQLIYNTHIGNEDAHAQNYSIFLENPSNLSMTPLYDTYPTWADPSLRRDGLCMPISGESLPEKMTSDKWKYLIRDSGLNVERGLSMVKSIVNGIRSNYARFGLPRAILEFSASI